MKMQSNGEEILHGSADAFCITGLTIEANPHYHLLTLRFCEVAIEHTTDATDAQVQQMQRKCNHLNDKLNEGFTRRITLKERNVVPFGQEEEVGTSLPYLGEVDSEADENGSIK